MKFLLRRDVADNMLAEMVREVDVDESGTIDFTEFVMMMSWQLTGMPPPLVVDASNRHCHLSPEHLDALFGPRAPHITACACWGRATRTPRREGLDR